MANGPDLVLRSPKFQIAIHGHPKSSILVKTERQFETFAVALASYCNPGLIFHIVYESGRRFSRDSYFWEEFIPFSCVIWECI